MFYLIETLLADTRQPVLEWLGLRAGNGLNQAEDAFGIPAQYLLRTTDGVKLQGKGGDGLSPPFEEVG